LALGSKHYALRRLKEFWVIWPLRVAVITLICQYAFGVIYGHQVTTLRCHSSLTAIVALKQLNDGRKA